ncbi:MAG: hypothetical protein JF619_22395 [Massilia sp.]|nr:hypothetical protein [Massilia sp.]
MPRRMLPVRDLPGESVAWGRRAAAQAGIACGSTAEAAPGQAAPRRGLISSRARRERRIARRWPGGHMKRMRLHVGSCRRGSGA